ncbi:MAG: 30S ribosomal protein S20 [SAR202 cluster bacterium]|nr:30S ribosomal protein S20 [SAR202 cluster bacterium]
MSSAKALRVSNKKRARNISVKSKVKNLIKTARLNIESNDSDENISNSVKDAIKNLDKAAQKGVLHKKNASRRKSRLMKSLK